MSESNTGAAILKEKNERLKMWIGLVTLIVTNIATLGTAITAHMRANDETTAKAAYKELSTAISEVSKDNIKLHNDVSNLRGYLAGVAHNGSLSDDTNINKNNGQHYIAESKTQNNTNQPSTSKPKKSGKKPHVAMPEPPKMSDKPFQYKPPPVDAL